MPPIELPSAVLTILLAIANVMGAGMIVPQVLRIRRRRSADGLSGAWVGVGIGLNVWWFLYATAEHLWGLLPVSIGAGVLYGVMAAQLTGIDGRRALGAIGRGIAIAGLVPAAALVGAGWTAAGLTLGSAYAVQFAPATAAALRAPSVEGISPLTWTMALLEALIWLTYGLATADAALQVGGTGGAVMAAIILGRVALGDRRPRRHLMAVRA